MNAKLKMLCELYDRSDENIDTYSLLKVCFFKNLEEVFKLLTREQLVKFACLCIKSVIHLCNSEEEKIVKYELELIEKWLEDYTCKKLLLSYSLEYSDSNIINAVNYAWRIAIDFWEYISDDACCFDDYIIFFNEDMRKQEYKNLGFLVKVIKDGP